MNTLRLKSLSLRTIRLTAVLLAALTAVTPTVHARVISPLLAGKVARGVACSGTGMARSAEKYIPLIIQLSSPEAQLPEEVVELHRRGSLVLAYVPDYMVGAVAGSGEVARMEGGQVCTPALDEARRFTGYPEIAAASGLPETYTGKGVVVGFTDIGFDPNHLAFLDPVTGKSRVRLLTDYGASPDDCVRLESPEEIAAWMTDDADQWHATHVAGILAGGYEGNPYRGIAPDAEIVATTSDLYDALLLAGMEDVVGYAGEVGKPAVINMSVSASLGPHDGTSLFCRYLEELSKEATICISAGNDGRRVGAWSCTFPEDGATAAAVIDYYTWSPAEAEGYIDVWSRDASVLNFAMVILDLDTEKVVAREEFPVITSDNPEQGFAIGTSAEALASIGADGSNSRVSEEFARYLDGVVALTTEINPGNNRFNGLYYLDVRNHPEEDGKLSWRYVVGLEVSGCKGQRMTGYTSSQLRFRDVPEYPGEAVRLGTDGVINDFITGKGVIGVGAMCSRDTWPLLNGEEGHGDCQVGDIAGFSSCCTGGVSGRLPDVVAPGAWLVSSVSTPYMEAHPDEIQTASRVDRAGDRDYYWQEACGTSMSSPYVAGICALWLQADPLATSAEIKDAILSTLTPPDMNPENPRWGRGILNSYNGLKAILAGAGVESVGMDGQEYGLPPLPSPLTPETLGGYVREHSCGIYDLRGRRVSPEAVYTLPRGVYILRSGVQTLKVVL